MGLRLTGSCSGGVLQLGSWAAKGGSRGATRAWGGVRGACAASRGQSGRHRRIEHPSRDPSGTAHPSPSAARTCSLPQLRCRPRRPKRQSGREAAEGGKGRSGGNNYGVALATWGLLQIHGENVSLSTSERKQKTDSRTKNSGNGSSPVTPTNAHFGVARSTTSWVHHALPSTRGGICNWL